jgi:mannan endo-1,4-beta-mannosidase
MKTLFTLCAGMALLLATALSTATPIYGATGLTSNTAHTDFVKVKGGHFVQRGKTYYVVGANAWYAAYLGSSGAVGDRARLNRELDSLKAMGVNNLRVLAMSEASTLKHSMQPASSVGPGQYDEALLVGLDYLLAALAKRDMTVVLYLNNFWQWSGGMTQYLAWVEGAAPVDPDVSGDWAGYMTKAASFYQNVQAQEIYRAMIAKLVARINTVNGVPYVDDPVILSWQLANEPRPGNLQTTAAQKRIYRKWIDDTARYIHQIAPHHMVSTGSEGVIGSGGDARLYARAHASSQVDYLTYHMWPKTWGWFDPKQASQTWSKALRMSRAYIEQHIAIARRLHKPLVLEEFGMERDQGAFDIASSTLVRDSFYSKVFGLIEGHAQRGAPIGGYNFWGWGGLGRAANTDFWWLPGDPLTADPPQEQQGLYSVFDSDVSTVALIAGSARRMHAMKK